MSTRLMATEISLLTEILSRRDPGLLDAVPRLGSDPIEPGARERIKRAIVDELCELPGAAGRRALELEELLIHLGPPERP